jgi:hypothetical protein
VVTGGLGEKKTNQNKTRKKSGRPINVRETDFFN